MDTVMSSVIEPLSGEAVERHLHAARRGCTASLGRLLEGCRQYLLLVANRELATDLRAKGGASDLVQETFLEAQRDFARFAGTSQAELLAWVRRILLHNVANFSRRYQQTAKRKLARELSLDGADGPLREHLPADQPSPSGRLIAAEQAQALERALLRLPEHYRRAVLLRHREQRSFAEIGAALNCSTEAARKLWARAIERLQQDLDPPHDTAP
jgi:RNA polymerase sigma-70 factor (ECF subfamily)